MIVIDDFHELTPEEREKLRKRVEDDKWTDRFSVRQLPYHKDTLLERLLRPPKETP
jgi:hypothetical protein